MTDESHIVPNCHKRILGIRGQDRGELTFKKEKAYSKANTIFCGVVIGVLTETVRYVPPLQNR
jgi:hypothetical protein